MKPNPDDIHVLMIRKLAGSISETEALYLDDLIEQDAHVREKWNKVKGKFTEEDLANKFERFNAGYQWQDVEEAVQQKGTKSVGMRRMMWAAAAAVFAIVSGYLFINRSSNQITGKPVAGNVRKSIELKLADGKTIDLSASKGQVIVGTTTLKNAGKALSYSTTNSGSPSGAENILTVPIGLDYKVQLADGTEVWLNSATTLRFPFIFSGSTREITLNGEAFLKVAKDPQRPFIVHLSNDNSSPSPTNKDLKGTSVQVIGTEFNINTYDAGVFRVALVEGSVKVKSPVDTIIIKPGEQATYTSNQKSIAINLFDEDEVLSWRQGMHYFHNATLREVCNVFPRWYGVNITMDNETLANNRCSGTLNRNEPLESFLSILQTTKTVNGYYIDAQGTLHLK